MPRSPSKALKNYGCFNVSAHKTIPFGKNGCLAKEKIISKIVTNPSIIMASKVVLPLSSGLKIIMQEIIVIRKNILQRITSCKLKISAKTTRHNYSSYRSMFFPIFY